MKRASSAEDISDGSLMRSPEAATHRPATLDSETSSRLSSSGRYGIVMCSSGCLSVRGTAFAP